ncbi:hypothetical protein [Micromonospora coerulea]
MPVESDAERLRGGRAARDALDDTKIWPEEDFPYLPVGNDDAEPQHHHPTRTSTSDRPLWPDWPEADESYREHIQETMVRHVSQCDEQYGRRVAEGLGSSVNA